MQNLEIVRWSYTSLLYDYPMLMGGQDSRVHDLWFGNTEKLQYVLMLQQLNQFFMLLIALSSIQ